jgi:hypothetical protein
MSIKLGGGGKNTRRNLAVCCASLCVSEALRGSSRRRRGWKKIWVLAERKNLTKRSRLVNTGQQAVKASWMWLSQLERSYLC